MAESVPRVLVVDDERFFREAIVEALAEAEIECDAVETGEQALAAARDPQLGVVVLDVTLADLSGIEVLRRLRSERPALRVIVLSAHTDQDLVLEALRLDASDYLAKPLHDEELVLAVRRALAGFDVESSWQRLRERVRRLEAHAVQLTALGDAAGAGEEDLAAFAGAAAEAVADVLEAGKTSVMLLDEEVAELWVAAATGSSVDPSEMDPVALGEGVAGVALSLGEAVIVDDVYSDERFAARTLRERYQSSSLAVAPLRSGERALGVLCATDRRADAPFGDDELALLKILAAPVTSFLARRAAARQAPVAAAANSPETPPHAERPAEDADAELAREICEALVLEIQPQRILDAALRAVTRRLTAPVVGLFLIDNVSGELVLECQVDDEGAGERERLPRDRGLTGSVLQTGAVVASGHPERDPRFDPDVDTAADGEVRPLLCLPLRLRGKVLGVFRAYPTSEDAASPRSAEILCAALSAAVRNILLYRSLLESIDEVAEARREAGSLARK
jgi:DNA-binding response OmpR family regulator